MEYEKLTGGSVLKRLALGTKMDHRGFRHDEKLMVKSRVAP